MAQPIAVVGAGQIGSALVRKLAAQGHAVAWISRTQPREVPAGVRFTAVDVCDADALTRALGDAKRMIVAINPTTYDAKVWAQTLPQMHRGLVTVAHRLGLRVVLLDGLYQYTLNQGPLRPDTPQLPATKKGAIRKQLLDSWRSSGVRPTLLCASDFWGPGLSRCVLPETALAGLQRGKPVWVIGNPDAPHAFSHVQDVVSGLINLALADDVAGLTFHAPVTHLTARQLVELGAKHVGVPGKVRRVPGWMLRVVGWFDRNTAGLIEMLPQWTAPYRVDDSAYLQRFNVEARTQW